MPGPNANADCTHAVCQNVTDTHKMWNACRLPQVVASNISLLASHLGGKAYPIRSAIVTAIGHLIERAFEATAQGADAAGGLLSLLIWGHAAFHAELFYIALTCLCCWELLRVAGDQVCSQCTEVPVQVVCVDAQKVLPGLLLQMQPLLKLVPDNIGLVHVSWTVDIPLSHKQVIWQPLNVHTSGTHARLRSKQQLLNTLVERVRDQNAYTRARVLQTWMHLAERKALPLGHWVCVTQLAVGEAHGCKHEHGVYPFPTALA